MDRPANQVCGPGRLCLHSHRRDTSAEPPNGVQSPDLSPLSSAPSSFSLTVATDATIRSNCWPLRDDRSNGQLCAPWHSRRRMGKDRVLLVHSRRQCNEEERGQGGDDTRKCEAIVKNPPGSRASPVDDKHCNDWCGSSTSWLISAAPSQRSCAAQTTARAWLIP